MSEDQSALSSLPSGLLKAVTPHVTPNDEVLFVLNGQSGQAMVALHDRLLIVKKGVFAGSMVGGKVTTFHYRDISNLEQRRALITPYLEVLTPSYQNNSANGDHHKADNAVVLQSRKDFDRHHELFALLRTKINEAKGMPAPIVSGGGDDLMQQFERLAQLRQTGTLTDDEFAAAKQKLLA